MEDGRIFKSEREYEKYVQDLVKGLEMLNLLLESNIHYEKLKNRNVSQFFRLITEKMMEIRNCLKLIKVIVHNDKNEERISSFYQYDFSFPVFDPDFHPILPEFVNCEGNKDEIEKIKEKIMEFCDLCNTKIIKKK